MLSQKRKSAIQEIISNAFHEELKEIEGPPEIMDEIEKERFDLLSGLEASISNQLDGLFDSWENKKFV